MAKKYFKRAADTERRRILIELRKTKPGTGQYRELQSQLGAYDLMEEKQNQGDIKPVDVFKFGGNLFITGVVLTADQWFPAVASKLKLVDFATKLIR